MQVKPCSVPQASLPSDLSVTPSLKPKQHLPFYLMAYQFIIPLILRDGKHGSAQQVENKFLNKYIF